MKIDSSLFLCDKNYNCNYNQKLRSLTLALQPVLVLPRIPKEPACPPASGDTWSWSKEYFHQHRITVTTIISFLPEFGAEAF